MFEVTRYVNLDADETSLEDVRAAMLTAIRHVYGSTGSLREMVDELECLIEERPEWSCLSEALENVWLQVEAIEEQLDEIEHDFRPSVDAKHGTCSVS